MNSIKKKMFRTSGLIKFVGNRNLGKVLYIGNASQSELIFHEIYNGDITRFDCTDDDLDIELFNDEVHNKYDSVLP